MTGAAQYRLLDCLTPSLQVGVLFFVAIEWVSHSYKQEYEHSNL
jgi:hypothetical protein